MSNSTRVALTALLLSSGLATMALADWVHYSNSVHAPAKNLLHIGNLSQKFVVPVDAAETDVCIFYSNSTALKARGKVTATATIHPLEGEPVTLNFAGGVQKNAYESCKSGPKMAAGTIVEFDYVFSGMPRVLGKQGQFVDVSGVVSADGEPGLTLLGLAPADGSGWIHNASSVFVADKDIQEHPNSLAQTLVLTQDSANPEVCVVYANTLGKRNQGRLVADIRVVRTDGSTESVKLVGGISKNLFKSCKSVGDLAVGDLVEFEVDFRNLPRIREEGSKREYADLNVLISTGGEVGFRVPTGLVSDPPEAGGGGGNPAPVGGISADDQRALSKLLLMDNKVQLQRPKGNSPAKFIVLGPNSRSLVSDPAKVDPATAGLGNTIAAAVADCERKRCGITGSGGPLDRLDLNAIIYYSNMDSSQGPTAVRRDGDGGWHSEWFRPGAGSVFNSGSSMAAVIETLQRQGL